jgi:ABC-type glutathione transport system ATPase component
LREAVDPQPSPPLTARHAGPAASQPGRPPTGGAVLDVRGMCIDLETSSGTLHPVRDVSFTLRAGETLAIVGESGSGKSLAALALLGLLPEPAYVTKGSAWLQGHNLLRLDQNGFDRVRGGVLSIVLQNAQSSFNPVQRIGAQIIESMHAHFALTSHEAKDETLALLSRVGISDAKSCAQAYPHELSHEMQLRALIALVIANDPRLLILDEPITALDPSIQKQIFALVTELRRELGMGVIFITRHLSAAMEFADRVLLMRAGEIVER